MPQVWYTVSRDTLVLLLHHSPDHRGLHSFPTRRSSDLAVVGGVADCRYTQRENHSALWLSTDGGRWRVVCRHRRWIGDTFTAELDRKSTRLNSSHRTISYAVFCLKKKIRN